MLRLHPVDAKRVGLVDGDRADVTSEHGTMTAIVAVDANVRAGVASVTHSIPGGGPGRLTSSTVGVDPLTGMPLASGVAVSIEPVPSSRMAR